MAVDALCDLHSAQGFGRSSKEISCMDGSPYKLTKVLPISAPLKFSVQSVQGLPTCAIFEQSHHPDSEYFD